MKYFIGLFVKFRMKSICIKSISIRYDKNDTDSIAFDEMPLFNDWYTYNWKRLAQNTYVINRKWWMIYLL